ncbi:MAG: hypothetical protein JSV96_07585 [Candidatus Aminicenantes bacterium]|nr:MAG: hypothetical protein JSV96_07585 [Candidatus Aminicenantes bacterium]
MNISYFEPLSLAWNRMKIALFKPFDLHKWFVVGFNAFLAGITEWPRGRGSQRVGDDGSFREFIEFPRTAWDWLISHPFWFMTIMFGVALLIVIVIVLTWLSSRGSFMFLDNVVHNRAEVANPWRNYKKEGNSLFLWRLVFGLICFGLFVIFFVIFFTAGGHLYRDSYYDKVPVLFVIQMALLFFLIAIVTGYISLFLSNFVVPIMYKNNIPATKAWGRFLSLFGKHPFHFLLFGILMFIMTVLVIILTVIAGLMTCCIGLILLIIPYVGTVVTLPIWYTFRAFSLEYLAQFGPEYDVFPPAEESLEGATA